MKKIIVFIVLIAATFSLNAQTYRVFKIEEYMKRGDHGYLQLIKELEFNDKENTISIEEDGFRTQGSIFKTNQYYKAYDGKVLDEKINIESMTFKYDDNGVERSGDFVEFYFPVTNAYAVLTLEGVIILSGQAEETVTKYYLKNIK